MARLEAILHLHSLAWQWWAVATPTRQVWNSLQVGPLCCSRRFACAFKGRFHNSLYASQSQHANCVPVRGHSQAHLHVWAARARKGVTAQAGMPPVHVRMAAPLYHQWWGAVSAPELQLPVRPPISGTQCTVLGAAAFAAMIMLSGNSSLHVTYQQEQG